MSAIHHIGLRVSTSGERAKRFYDTVLGGLGFASPSSNGVYLKDDLIILVAPAEHEERPRHGAIGLGHIAFSVGSREAVDNFYNDVLLKLDGVTIEDPPVDCPEYGYEEYYATFFYDVDGIKLEVVYSKGICTWAREEPHRPFQRNPDQG